MGSANIIDNISPILFILSLVLIFYFFFWLATKVLPCKSIREKLKTKYEDSKKKIFFNQIIRSISLSYLMFAISVSVAITDQRMQDPLERSANVIASCIILIIFLLSYQIFTTWYLHKYRYQLDQEKHKLVVKNFYSNVDIRVFKKPNGYLFYPMFLLRRNLFVAVPVIFTFLPSL